MSRGSLDWGLSKYIGQKRDKDMNKPDLPPVSVNKVLLEPLEPWSCFISSMATSLVQ